MLLNAKETFCDQVPRGHRPPTNRRATESAPREWGWTKQARFNGRLRCSVKIHLQVMLASYLAMQDKFVSGEDWIVEIE